MKTTNLLAVYGTLKKNYGNHVFLKNAKYLGTHITEPKYTMYSMGGFPTVTLEGNTPITLEIYSVDKETKKHINMLEGYTGKRNSDENWYDTTDVDTPWGTAEMYYFKNKPNNMIVPDGNW